MARQTRHESLPLAGPGDLAAQEEATRRFWRRPRVLGVGAIVVISAIGAYRHFSEQSGQLISYDPKVDAPALEDNILRIGSWNMEGRAARDFRLIARLGQQENLDVIDLQEVTADDAATLQDLLPSWHQEFVKADSLQHGVADLAHGDQGGYGDMILSRTRPYDIQRHVLPGTSWYNGLLGTITGASQDIITADIQFTHTKAGRQENRIVLAETINVDYNNQPIPVREMTAHIAGLNPTHRDQESELLGFVDDNQSNTIPLVFAGDLNQGDNETINNFVNHKMQVVPSVGRTSLTHNVAIDHAAYNPAGRLGNPTLQVIHQIGNHRLTKKDSDHYPIVVSFDLKPGVNAIGVSKAKPTHGAS